MRAQPGEHSQTTARVTWIGVSTPARQESTTKPRRQSRGHELQQESEISVDVHMSSPSSGSKLFDVGGSFDMSDVWISVLFVVLLQSKLTFQF
jgi:hypothetical protein